MKNVIINSNTARNQRQTRSRKNTWNSADRPRLSVHRSNKYCYAQIIDHSGNTVITVSEKVIAKTGKDKMPPLERAKEVGVTIAKKALEKKITAVSFEKGRFAYHGRVKAIAEGARAGGLQF